MIARAALASLLVASLQAPLQCSRGADPALRREDTAGDALYALAQDFRAKGDERAARDTLRYLVEHYPSSRHVPAARTELGEEDALPSADAPSADGAPSANGAAAVDVEPTK